MVLKISNIFRPTKKSLIFILISTLIFIFFGIFCSVLIVFYISSFETTLHEPQTYDYQFTEINPSYPTAIQQGFVELPTVLQNEDYISYRNEETGSLFLITHFGGQKFECSGSCSCTDSSSRRTSTTLLTRGLHVLLSAFSITMAMKLAEEAFQNECIQKHSDTCQESNILSEVENCEEEKEDEKEIQKGDSSTSSENLFCKGHCIVSSAFDQIFKVMSTPGLPNSLEKHHVIIMKKQIVEAGEHTIGKCEDLKLEKTASSEEEFESQLDEFCKDNSKIDEEEPEALKKMGEGIYGSLMVHLLGSTPFCAGVMIEIDWDGRDQTMDPPDGIEAEPVSFSQSAHHMGNINCVRIN